MIVDEVLVLTQLLSALWLYIFDAYNHWTNSLEVYLPSIFALFWLVRLI